MGIIAEFKQGCSDGWKLYWSPLSGFVRMAKGIVSQSESGQAIQAS
jgi:hypothetical protein